MIASSKNTHDINAHVWVVSPLLVGLVTPSLVIYSLDVVVAHRNAAAALEALARRQFAGGENLFLIALLGLLPFAVLAAVLGLVSRSPANRYRVPLLSFCGTAGALALMVPAHVAVWLPLYTGTHQSSTAVVAFVFIPFYACLTMVLGLAVGALSSARHHAGF